MCWSASFSESTGSVLVSGVVAMRSVDLQLDDVVLDHDREGVDRDIGGQGLRLAGPQIEERAVARAFDGAVLRIDLALGERAVVVRAAVLDGVDLAVAVEDADLEVLPFHDARGAGRELRERADVDDLCGHKGKVPAGRRKSDAEGLDCTGRARRCRNGPGGPERRPRRGAISAR